MIHITKTLLESWRYCFSCAEGYEDEAYADFLRTIQREPGETTEAMMNGLTFEDRCYRAAEGKTIRSDAKWREGALKVGEIIRGAQIQVPIGEAPATLKLGDRELKNYSEGPDVKELQETLISLGYDCGSYGADGEFGDCTEMAVRAFQKDAGVKVNGKYDADTHKALTAVLDKQQPEAEPEKAQYVQIQKNCQCYVRTAPSTDGKALGIAHSEDKLPYQGQTSENGWLLVAYTPKGETVPTNAWVSGKYGKLVT